ncbi:hypothetical protein WJX81_008513 [Elliptochloris bilobata]|uniref:Calcineurin-like phosphoesterase domain-containing protein n=1 Tax=Elliptochloris bilobata TaxID=381761 RepID=A0AAW1QZ70_9CHLO
MCSPRHCAQQVNAGTVRLALVGDVHGHWSSEDAEALAWLNADAVILVGDFGEEDLELIYKVAVLQVPKAVMLGNHDAWFSLTARSRTRWHRGTQRNAVRLGYAGGVAASKGVEEDSQGSTCYDGVRAQLRALGNAHVGFGSLRVRAASGQELSIVGARPFSKGGGDARWRDVQAFYATMYLVQSPEESARRIVAEALLQPPGAPIVLVAHNGPAGLGSAQHNICGVDFSPNEGDHGDDDLTAVLRELAAAGRHVPLVVFGHMHQQLKGGGQRDMVAISATTGTVHLNAAVVPRGPPGAWRVVRKEALLRSADSGDPHRLVRRAWHAFSREWEPVVSPRL